MIRLIPVLLSFAMLCLSAVELERDHTYTGPLKLTVQSLGVGLGLPVEWHALLPKSGGLYLRRPGSTIEMTIRAQEFERSEALEYLSLPIRFDEDVMLFPEKRIIELSPTRIRRSFSVSGRDAVAMLYIVLGPQRRAAVLTGVAPKDELMSMQNSMLSIANTITFTQIRPSSEMATTFKKRISGGYYVYYQHVGDHDEKREIWLCSDGRYVLKGERAVALNTSTMSDTHHGIWHLKDRALVLDSVDGRQRSIRLKEEENVLFFDGGRSFSMKNRVCR